MIKILNNKKIIQITDAKNGDIKVDYENKEYFLKLVQSGETNFGNVAKYETEVQGKKVTVVQHAWDGESYTPRKVQRAEADTGVESFCKLIDSLKKKG